MAIDRITSKGTRGGYVVGNFSAGGFIAPASSNQVVGANTALETVNEMFITDVFYATSNGVTYTVKRGANTVLQVSGAGDFHFAERGVTLEVGGESAANCVIVKTGSGVASLVIKLHKRSSIAGGSIY